MVAIKTEDFSKFEASYKQRAEARSEAGIDTKAYRVVGDENRAIVMGTAPSIEAFKQFMKSPGQEAAMSKAAMLEPPVATFLEEQD